MKKSSGSCRAMKYGIIRFCQILFRYKLWISIIIWYNSPCQRFGPNLGQPPQNLRGKYEDKSSKFILHSIKAIRTDNHNTRTKEFGNDFSWRRVEKHVKSDCDFLLGNYLSVPFAALQSFVPLSSSAPWFNFIQSNIDAPGSSRKVWMRKKDLKNE